MSASFGQLNRSIWRTNAEPRAPSPSVALSEADVVGADPFEPEPGPEVAAGEDEGKGEVEGPGGESGSDGLGMGPVADGAEDESCTS